MKKTKTIGCEEALRHLLTFLDRELGPAKRRQVEHHLEICRSCFSRAEFERRLKAQLQEIGQESADGPLETRIKAILSRF